MKLAILPLNGRTRRGAYLVVGLARGAALVGPAVAIADTTAVTYYACAIGALVIPIRHCWIKATTIRPTPAPIQTEVPVSAMRPLAVRKDRDGPAHEHDNFRPEPSKLGSVRPTLEMLRQRRAVPGV